MKKSPNDPISLKTPVIQVLSQIAFWEMKTPSEQEFAKKHSKDADGIRKDFILLLSKNASAKKLSNEIEIHSPGNLQTINQLAKKMDLEQVFKFEKSLPGMTKIVYEKTKKQGLKGFFYNWMQKQALKNPEAHWGWSQKIMNNRRIVWKDRKIK